MLRNYQYVRTYTGPLKAVVLDWSGTVADKYVIAPAAVFKDVFKKYKVPISFEEAREPMGLRKDLHIKSILERPSVSARWREVYGRDPVQADVDAMFKDYIPMQLACLKQFGTLLPGCAEAMHTLRTQFNMKIGTTTGFVKSMSDIMLSEAIKQGHTPDAVVAGDEVVNGVRPKPFMLWHNLDLMDVSPIQAVVKVDDTVGGVEEGLEAGCWAVGVSRYSNYMQIDDEQHEASLSPEDLAKKNEASREILLKSGAHYVVDSVADLPLVCKDINERLARGEKP